MHLLVLQRRESEENIKLVTVEPGRKPLVSESSGASRPVEIKGHVQNMNSTLGSKRDTPVKEKEM